MDDDGKGPIGKDSSEVEQPKRDDGRRTRDDTEDIRDADRGKGSGVDDDLAFVRNRISESQFVDAHPNSDGRIDETDHRLEEDARRIIDIHASSRDQRRELRWSR